MRKAVLILLFFICITFTYYNQANAENIKNYIYKYNKEEIESCMNTGLSQQKCKNALNYYYKQKTIITKQEEDTQECLDKGITMQNCNYKAIEKYEAELTNIINNYEKILPKEQYSLLLLSQSSWEKYYNNNIDFQNGMKNSKKSTISTTIFPGQIVNCLKNRIEELLSGYYSFITLE